MTKAQIKAAIEKYSPRVSKAYALVLDGCPYDSPTSITDAVGLKIAKSLRRVGLLERHPDQRDLYRCTEAGAAVVKGLRDKGWL